MNITRAPADMMEELREKLYQAMDNSSYDKILALSRELDTLILLEMRTLQKKNTKKVSQSR